MVSVLLLLRSSASREGALLKDARPRNQSNLPAPTKLFAEVRKKGEFRKCQRLEGKGRPSQAQERD